MHGVNRRELTKVSVRQTVVSGAAVKLNRVFHNIQAHAPCVEKKTMGRLVRMTLLWETMHTRTHLSHYNSFHGDTRGNDWTVEE